MNQSLRVTFLCFLLATPLMGQVAPPNTMGVSMGHVHVVTSDPETQKKIWIDVLGGKLVKAGPLEYAMFPGVFIGFRKGESNGGTDGSVVNHLGFLVQNAAAVRAKLIAAGVAVPGGTSEVHQFMALLPDGIKVEFTEDANLGIPIKSHHLHFATDHVEDMRAWYSRVLGAVPGTRGKFQAADLPGVNLSWTVTEAPTLPIKGRVLDHIGFEVRDIKAFCQKLETSGMTLDMPPTARPDLGLIIAFITDPWGTRIELTEGLNKY